MVTREPAYHATQDAVGRTGSYFCSQAFLGGAAEADIKDWLGHRDSKMVAHNHHLRRDDSQRKMQQIDFLSQNDRTVQSSG